MVNNKNQLSAKQAEILSLIEEEVARTGRPPTYRDIAKQLGYSAVGTVQDHIRALITKGFLHKAPGLARGLTLAHQSESLSVPILGSVPAGRPIEAIEDSQGSIPIRARKGAGELFALKVKGDSMVEAGILEGDYVIVRKQNDAQHGEIVVALLDGEATVKYLERRMGRIRLLPANSRYAPIEVEGTIESLIQGRVIGLQRYYI